jgi:hypothetical protein
VATAGVMKKRCDTDGCAIEILRGSLDFVDRGVHAVIEQVLAAM